MCCCRPTTRAGAVEPLLGLAVQLPGRPLPPDVTDYQTLWDLNAQGYNELYGPALNAHRVANGLPAADNVRAHVLGDHPWLAADPILAPWHEPADLDVVQTGAWFVPDERPLPAERTTAAPAPRRRPPGQARPRWWCPNGRTSRTSGRVAELGIGAAHDVQAPTIESLSAALSTALTQQTRARATAVAGMTRADGATVAAKLLVNAAQSALR